MTKNYNALVELRKKYPDDQKSESWLERTKYSIGGSSIYTVDKHRINTFYKNVCMLYGTLMEDVVIRYLEIKHNINILRYGAIPYITKYDGTYVAHYSPDGIFNTDNSKNLNNMFGSDENVLLEIKVPWSRSKSSTIVPRYMHQVQYGMNILENINNTLFIDAFIKICIKPDLKTHNLNYCDIHDYTVNGSHNKQEYNRNSILGYGFISLTPKKNYIFDNYIFDSFRLKYLPKYYNTIEAGEKINEVGIVEYIKNTKKSYRHIKGYKKDYDIKKFTHSYVDIGKYIKDVLPEIEKYNTEIIVFCGDRVDLKKKLDNNTFGYIFFKIFDVNYIKVKKNTEFLNEERCNSIMSKHDYLLKSLGSHNL